MLKKMSISKIIKWLILIAGGITMVFPFYWMVITSIKIQSEVMKIPPVFIPTEVTFERYWRVLTELNFARFFFNSIYIATAVTLAVLFTSSILGYVFTKFKFRGRDIIFMGLLSTMMIPAAVTMIPLYLLLGKVGLVNSHLAIILPGLFSVFGIFLMRQTMQSIPDEFIEAGRIDGASEFTIFFKLILPQAKATLSALAIFTFMVQWNNFLWPLIVLTSEKQYTLPLGLRMFQGQYWTDMGLVMTGATISVIPIIIVFLFMQRTFVKGITMTGLKG
ncbi:carbohydrate ABC transporter permease [Halocella sp. SP3-1]|uniref:carbohydrate ABC transporter permease n=1 Tax=Halocella sp. SP3-1 TaxID=2382161 RepID=UPI00197A8F1B|nr:carbohydrate ABC transporter permease [Halocella sp. SP3-1]